jgi:mono/diheme cytochrome c family protein
MPASSPLTRARLRCQGMTKQAISVVIVIALGASVVVSARSFGASVPKTTVSSAALGPAAHLYREFCGQCHALARALSAGFGSATNKLGTNGGPSFNNLRVPYSMSVDAVAEPTGGHEGVRTRISTKELTEVATYIAKVTARNPIPATATDG